MTDFVVEHSIKMNLFGKEMFNIFHTLDVTGTPLINDYQDAFIDNWVSDMSILQSGSLNYISIASRVLNSLDPRLDLTQNIGISGNLGGGDVMPTGVHIWLLLKVLGFGLRSGGKLIPGFVEAQFSLGIPDPAVLTDIQLAIQATASALTVLGGNLAVYHPTYSAPGLPVASIVTAWNARGASTNNRRRLDFQN